MSHALPAHNRAIICIHNKLIAPRTYNLQKGTNRPQAAPLQLVAERTKEPSQNYRYKPQDSLRGAKEYESFTFPHLYSGKGKKNQQRACTLLIFLYYYARITISPSLLYLHTLQHKYREPMPEYYPCCRHIQARHLWYKPRTRQRHRQ